MREGTSSGGSKNSIPYEDGDFDRYACYIPDKDAVIFPPFSLKGKKISLEKINRKGYKYYYWEDYLSIDSEVLQRNSSNEKEMELTTLQKASL